MSTTVMGLNGYREDTQKRAILPETLKVYRGLEIEREKS